MAASGLTGGNDLATTVYPFIVRGVALLGIDTVATPDRGAAGACGREMADVFPLDRCEQMVNEEIGLDGLTGALDRVLDAGGAGPRSWSGPRSCAAQRTARAGAAQERGVTGETRMVPLLQGARRARTSATAWSHRAW